MNNKIQGKKVVGAKQVVKVIKNGRTSCVYIGKDAEIKVIRPIEELCKEHDISIVYVDTMKELGRMCGIDVGAATAALINE